MSIERIGRVLVAMLAVGIALFPSAGDVWSQSPEQEIPTDVGSSAATATFLAPSAAQGDYGAKLGNVRDMDSVDDIAVKPVRVKMEKSPVGGTVVRGYAPREPYTAWPIAIFSSSVPIPTRTYHHAIYRLRIAAEGTCATNGRLAYSRVYTPAPTPIYSYPFLPQIPPMSCPFGDFCVYYVDLATNYNGSRCPTWTGSMWPSDPSPWLGGNVLAFGIAPHEYWEPGTCGPGGSGGPEYYDLDFVYLTGDIVAREQDQYRYTARWNVHNPEGLLVTSTVRHKQLDELQLPSNPPSCSLSDFSEPLPPTNVTTRIYLPVMLSTSRGGTPWTDFDPIVRTVTRVKGVSVQSYGLSFADDSTFIDGKSYYLCVEVDNGKTRTYTVSNAPVIRVPLPPRFGGCGW